MVVLTGEVKRCGSESLTPGKVKKIRVRTQRSLYSHLTFQIDICAMVE
jgi:hypothetical protein